MVCADCDFEIANADDFDKALKHAKEMGHELYLPICRICDKNIFELEDEDLALYQCAECGRSVCDTCDDTLGEPNSDGYRDCGCGIKQDDFEEPWVIIYAPTKFQRILFYFPDGDPEDKSDEYEGNDP